MPNKNPNTTGLSEYHQRVSQEKERAVESALKRLNKSHSKITVAQVAREAGVSAPYIYNHPELFAKVNKLRSATSSLQAVPDVSKSDSIVNALRLKIRNMEMQHRNEIAFYKTELAEANQKIERLTAEIILSKR